MIALYDYDPQELSPNVDAEVELKFSTGDVITVFGDMDDDGFYLAELRGSRGLVPSNFLTDAKSGTQVSQTVVPPNVMTTDPTRKMPLLSGASGPPPPPREPTRTKREEH